MIKNNPSIILVSDKEKSRKTCAIQNDNQNQKRKILFLIYFRAKLNI
jgi:hypothetical protein